MSALKIMLWRLFVTEAGEFMFVRNELQFPHKAILTSAMLKEIYNYPREVSRLVFKEYGDGIICGLDYSIKNGDLTLSSGIFRLDGEIYLLQDNLNISELAEKNFLVNSTEYFMAFEKKSCDKEQCLTEKNLELIFTREKPACTLGSFVFLDRKDFFLPALTDGRNPFENIFRRSVLNLFEVPFAQKQGATFHPLLFRLVKNFLVRKKNKTPFDYAILIHLQNSETLSSQTLLEYIDSENKTCDIENREKFFETFLICLLESKFNVAIYKNDDENIKPAPRKVKPLGRLI